MMHDDCEPLFESSRALLEKSGLVHYSDYSFMSNKDEPVFENYWQKRFHPEFGRYMAWIWFSVGAENLLKAALVCRGRIKGKSEPLGYPFYSVDQDRQIWISQVLKSEKGAFGNTEAQKYEYGALGPITQKEPKWLLRQQLISKSGCDILTAAYKYLSSVIRNRRCSYIREEPTTKRFSCS